MASTGSRGGGRGGDSILGRVLIIVENLPVPFDRRVWMEANALTVAGYQVSVISPTGKGFESRREDIDGIAVYRHPLPRELSSAAGYLREYAAALWHQWRLARRIHREQGFDVIHACNPPDLTFLVGLWFKLLHGKTFLFDHHDLAPELFESKFNKRGPFHSLLRLAERLTFRTADTVICTNESYREVAMGRGRKAPEDVFVVRSGPNLEKFKAVAPQPDYKRGRRFMVGYLGVMGEFDGVDHLVRAAAALIHDHGRTDIQFCLIGDGPTRQALQDLAAALKISDWMDFPGRVSDEEMIARLSTCDVCVDPDPLNPLNDKSTMNKVLEYMALGRPVVQYDLTEGRRSAADASLYAEPNNTGALAAKIAELLDDPTLCEKLGEIGRQRMANELEWKHQVPKLLAAYARLFRRDHVAVGDEQDAVATMSAS